MKELIKLAIVDDNTIFRNGLIVFLKRFKTLKVIIEVSNGKELIEALEKQKPDLVLLDVEMPIMDGIETTEYLSKYHQNIKILILTAHNDDELSRHLIEKGANGFLLKDNNITKVVDAIDMITKHQYYFAGWDLKKIVAFKESKNDTKIMVQFTERELEVIELVCQQHTNKEISNKLFISTRTVDGYRDKILQKTNSRNTAGLVMYAVKNGLIIP